MLFIFSLFVLEALCLGSPAVSGSPDNQIIIRPDKVTKSVGEVAQILCTWKNEPLEECTFIIPHAGINLSPIKENLYFGKGLQTGECGINITVEETFQGNISCLLTNKDNHFLEATMHLEVAKEPKEPVLSLEYEKREAGNTVVATCVVAEGRPAAEITWAFDGVEDFNKIIKQQHDWTITPVGDTTTVTERATWVVTTDDDQKQVTCAASHYTWIKHARVTKTIIVYYKPRFFNENNESQEDILYPNLALGEAASLIVKVKSNPAPTDIGMTIDNTTLTVGQDDHQQYQLSALKQVNGYHLYNLTIRHLTKEVLHQVCTFNVTNSEGSSVARLTFSTRLPSAADTAQSTEKPRAVAGHTVTGVIIAVILVIIISIGVLMFAKFNKKWCFASKPRVYTGKLVASE